MPSGVLMQTERKTAPNPRFTLCFSVFRQKSQKIKCRKKRSFFVDFVQKECSILYKCKNAKNSDQKVNIIYHTNQKTSKNTENRVKCGEYKLLVSKNTKNQKTICKQYFTILCNEPKF